MQILNLYDMLPPFIRPFWFFEDEFSTSLNSVGLN